MQTFLKLLEAGLGIDKFQNVVLPYNVNKSYILSISASRLCTGVLLVLLIFNGFHFLVARSCYMPTDVYYSHVSMLSYNWLQCHWDNWWSIQLYRRHLQMNYWLSTSWTTITYQLAALVFGNVKDVLECQNFSTFCHRHFWSFAPLCGVIVFSLHWIYLTFDLAAFTTVSIFLKTRTRCQS